MRTTSVVMLLWNVTAVAWAQVPAEGDGSPTARLDFVAPESCAGADVLRDLVTARLGYSPFVNEAREAIEVVIEEDTAGYLGLVDSAETSAIRSASCDDVLEAIAMLVALKIDPLGRGASEAPRRALTLELEALNDETPPAPPPPERAPEPATRPWSLRVELAAIGSLGVAPSPSLGGMLGLAARTGAFDVGVAFTLESSVGGRDLDGATLHAIALRAGIVPCGVLSSLRLCGVVDVGQLRVRANNVGTPKSGSALFAYAGMRLAVDFGRPGLGGSVALQAAVSIARPSLLFGESVVWEAPFLIGGLLATFHFDVHRSDGGHRG